jgi:hypothetical protein
MLIAPKNPLLDTADSSLSCLQRCARAHLPSFRAHLAIKLKLATQSERQQQNKKRPREIGQKPKWQISPHPCEYFTENRNIGQ